MRAIVTVVGMDKVGIIGRVCSQLSAYNVNVLDIRQTIQEGFFTMSMVVDVTVAKLPFTELVIELQKLGKEMALDIHAQNEEIFNAMHSI